MKFIHSTDCLERNKWLSIWVSHWVLDLIDLFKNTNSFVNETNDSLTEGSHWSIYTNDSFKNTDPFRNESEWVIKLFTQCIHTKTLILSRTKQMTVYIIVIELFTHAIHSKTQIHPVKNCVVLEDTVYSAFALFGTVFIGRSKIIKTTAFIVPKNVC